METENTMDDAQERKEILKNIEEYGCHLILIEGDNYCPAFVYSIGLYQKFGHPEIICFGLRTFPEFQSESEIARRTSKIIWLS